MSKKGAIPIIWNIVAFIFIVIVLIGFYLFTVFADFLSNPTKQTIEAVETAESDILLINFLRTPVLGPRVLELDLVHAGDTYLDFLIRYGNNAPDSYASKLQRDLLFDDFYSMYGGASYELSVDNHDRGCDSSFEFVKGIYLCLKYD